MPFRIAQRLAGIMNAVVGMQQVVDNAFRSHEDGAVLVQHRHADLLGYVLEGDEVLSVVGAKVLQPIAVVVDKPASVNLRSSGTFHHLAREGFRGL